MRKLFIALLLGGLARAGAAAEYSRQPLLGEPIAVGDSAVFEARLSAPVSRRGDMVQLDIVFSTEAGGKNAAPRGAVNLVVTLAGDNGEKYSADIVTGDFYPGGVLAKFASLPPRKLLLRRIFLRGLSVPAIKQIYWVEGREKLSGVDENLAHCEAGKCGWREAMDYCRSRGGRLLRLAELKTMYLDECAGREPGACAAGYWSANEYAAFPRKAWYLDFSDGTEVSVLKSHTAYVRCIVPAGAVYKSKK